MHRTYHVHESPPGQSGEALFDKLTINTWHSPEKRTLLATGPCLPEDFSKDDFQHLMRGLAMNDGPQIAQ